MDRNRGRINRVSGFNKFLEKELSCLLFIVIHGRSVNWIGDSCQFVACVVSDTASIRGIRMVLVDSCKIYLCN